MRLTIVVTLLLVLIAGCSKKSPNPSPGDSLSVRDSALTDSLAVADSVAEWNANHP